MLRFSSVREAKDFLASKIVEEAQREGISLSEVERKMLYFSERGWTLPDMAEVSDKFDRTCDQNEYEKKITRLIKSASRRARRTSPEEYDTWRSAVRALQREDHYILVMIRHAGLPERGDTLKSLAIGATVMILFLCAIFISESYGIELDKYLSRGALAIEVWTLAVFALVVYLLLRLILGTRRADSLINKLLEKVFRNSEREG